MQYIHWPPCLEFMFSSKLGSKKVAELHYQVHQEIHLLASHKPPLINRQDDPGREVTLTRLTLTLDMHCPGHPGTFALDLRSDEPHHCWTSARRHKLGADGDGKPADYTPYVRFNSERPPSDPQSDVL